MTTEKEQLVVTLNKLTVNYADALVDLAMRLNLNGLPARDAVSMAVQVVLSAGVSLYRSAALNGDAGPCEAPLINLFEHILGLPQHAYVRSSTGPKPITNPEGGRA